MMLNKVTLDPRYRSLEQGHAEVRPRTGIRDAMAQVFLLQW